jgi:hypothetical protein
MIDILLGDVKNERGENEEGVVTLGEIAAEMGFENRQILAHPPSVMSPVNGLVRGRYLRSFVPMVITFRKRTIKTVFLVDTGGTATFIGKPTWDRLMEGFEDTGQTTIKGTLNGFRAQELNLSPQDSHFSDIDLLGTTFLAHIDSDFHVSYKEKTCYLEWPEDL